MPRDQRKTWTRWDRWLRWWCWWSRLGEVCRSQGRCLAWEGICQGSVMAEEWLFWNKFGWLPFKNEAALGARYMSFVIVFTVILSDKGKCIIQKQNTTTYTMTNTYTNEKIERKNKCSCINSSRLLHLVHDEKIKCVGHIARADGDEEEIVSLKNGSFI